MGMENGKMGAKVVLHFAAAISLEMVVLYNLTNQLTSSSLQWLVIHLWSRCPLLIHINLSDSQTDESATLPSHNFRRQKHKSHDNKHRHHKQQHCKWILTNAGISYWHFSSIRWNHSHESCFPQLSNTTHGERGDTHTLIHMGDTLMLSQTTTMHRCHQREQQPSQYFVSNLKSWLKHHAVEKLLHLPWRSKRLNRKRPGSKFTNRQMCFSSRVVGCVFERRQETVRPIYAVCREPISSAPKHIIQDCIVLQRFVFLQKGALYTKKQCIQSWECFCGFELYSALSD